VELRAEELLVRRRLRQSNVVIDESTGDEYRTSVQVALPHDRDVLPRFRIEDLMDRRLTDFQHALDDLDCILDRGRLIVEATPVMDRLRQVGTEIGPEADRTAVVDRHDFVRVRIDRDHASPRWSRAQDL